MIQSNQPAPAEPVTKPGTKEKEKQDNPWRPPSPKVDPTPKA